MNSVATYVPISPSGVVKTPFITVWFAPFFSTEMKTAFCQPKQLFHEVLHLRKLLVDSLHWPIFFSELNRRGQFQNSPCMRFLSLIPLISCRFSWFCPDPVSTNPSMCCRVVRIVQTCRLPQGGILPLSRTSCLCKHEPRCEREINTFRIWNS